MEGDVDGHAGGIAQKNRQTGGNLSPKPACYEAMIAVAMARADAPADPAEPAFSARARPRATRAAEVDAATLERCKAQDPAAFRVFVTRYERPVFALLSRLLGRGSHVEDLAQETFLRAFRALPRFDVDGTALPSTWLLTIATRLALDARRRGKLVPAPLAAAEGVASGTDPETERARHELGRRLERAAAELTGDQRAVFVLSELHGLSHAEIARAVGVGEGTVKTRLFRAREHMRAALGTAADGTAEDPHHER